MAERTVGSLTVTISESCISAAGGNIKIELDDVLNNGKTCFEPNQDIYLRCYPSPHNMSFTVKATNGTIKKNATAAYSTHEESVTISDGTGTVSYPIYSITSRAWFGIAPCPIAQLTYTQGYDELRCTTCTGSPDGGVLCDVTYGVLEITYTARYYVLTLNVSDAGEVVVYAYSN